MAVLPKKIQDSSQQVSNPGLESLAQEDKDALSTFAGFDDNGNPVFADKGEYRSLDKNEFSDLTEKAKKAYGDKKFSDYYADRQADDIQKDMDFLGFDDQNKAVFKNKQGIVERTDQGVFQQGLKRQYGDAKYNESQLQTDANRKANENTSLLLTQRRGNTAAGNQMSYNPAKIPFMDRLKQDGQPPKIQEKQMADMTADKFKQEQKNQQKLQKQRQDNYDDLYKKYYNEMGGDNYNQEPPNLNQPQQKQPSATQQLAQQAYDQYGKPVVNNATQPYRDQAKAQLNQLTDPYKEQLKGYLPDSVKDNMGMFSDAQNIMNIAKDPKAFLANQIKQQTQNAIKSQVQNSLTNTALNTIPGGVGAGMAGIQSLMKGGDAGDAMGRAAAQAALASTGVGAIANPEMLQAGANLSNAAANKLSNSGLGGAGNLLGTQAKIAGTGMQLGADLGNNALNTAGGLGSDFFGNVKNTFNDSKGAVKQITSGDIAGGLTNLGSSALKNTLTAAYKAPAQVAKRAADAAKNALKSVGGAIGNIFCFVPDTMIIMEDGSLKRAGDIEVGDMLLLGGTVTAVGEALNQDIHDLNGIKVSGGHAVFYKGKWSRVNKISDAKRLENKEVIKVIPISCENHLIMTNNYQIWADMDEVDDTFNKTDTQILKELNSRDKINSVLKNFNNKVNNGKN